MKKISTTAAQKIEKVEGHRLTIGPDLGDRSSWFCVLNEAGEVLLEQKLATTPKAMKEVFGGMPRSRIALETGMHSPWVSRCLSDLGHEVIVAHARNVRLIGRRKDDRFDARTLARLARIDPDLGAGRTAFGPETRMVGPILKEALVKSVGSFAPYSAFVFGCLIALLPSLGVPATAQLTDQGENAICKSAKCSTLIPSPAFIDASAFCNPQDCTDVDFCATVNEALNALNQLSPAGGVVDARGINSGSENNKCTDTTPYTGAHTITAPSTLLLPSGTITINQTWVLPDRTRIIGQGNNPSTSVTHAHGTYILASGIPAGAAMIEMGSNALCDDPPGSNQCYGVSVEYLMLEAENKGSVIDGIWNFNSGESSYVDHVNFSQVVGTGLTIGGNATGSGPYSNLAMAPGALCSTTTACVKLGDATGMPLSTHGVHSLTCTCQGSGKAGGTGNAGIMLNSPNNTLEDIHFEGFIDGIQVGNQVPSATINTKSNVIKNVNGSGSHLDTMTNVIHICAAGGASCGNPNNVVGDLTIEETLSTRREASYPVTNVLRDDVTNTTIPSLNQSETSVAKYVLGEALAGGYSRFATSPVPAVTGIPGIPTWDVGISVPKTSACQAGSLFSNINGAANGGIGGNNYTLWVCAEGTWQAIKK